MNKLAQDTALIIIDVQVGFDAPYWGQRNNSLAEGNIAQLLQVWRQSGRPIIHVQHLSTNLNSPLHPTSAGSKIKKIVEPHSGEPVVQKEVNSAFIGTDLERMLREQNIQKLVITGLTTPHCVSTTTRMAGNLGFETYIVSDATAAFEMTGHDGKVYSAEEIHAVTLATLHQEFAEVVDTESILASL